MSIINTLGGIRKEDVDKYHANPKKYPKAPRHPPENRVIGRDDLPTSSVTEPSAYPTYGKFHISRLKRQLSGPLPKNYDWRQHTTCQSVKHIRHQNCNDCWVMVKFGNNSFVFVGKQQYFTVSRYGIRHFWPLLSIHEKW